MKRQELTAAVHVIHVVQPGETLSSIGGLYGMTYQAMMEAEDLTDPGLTEVGQELIMPPRVAAFAAW
jgi:LysM repeat protein